MGNTKIDLVRDLKVAIVEKDLSEKQIEQIETIIAHAEKGMYHDFDSELATPKMQLHMDLLAVGLTDIDKKMQNGDYDDESATPEQEKELMDLLYKK